MTDSAVECSNCQAPVTPDELLDGLAVRVDGLHLCPQCVDLLPQHQQVAINRLRALQGLTTTTYLVPVPGFPGHLRFSFTTATNINQHRRSLSGGAAFTVMPLPPQGAPRHIKPDDLAVDDVAAVVPTAKRRPPWLLPAGIVVGIMTVALAAAALTRTADDPLAAVPARPTRSAFPPDPLAAWQAVSADPAGDADLKATILLEAQSLVRARIDDAQADRPGARAALRTLALPDDINFRSLARTRAELIAAWSPVAVPRREEPVPSPEQHPQAPRPAVGEPVAPVQPSATVATLPLAATSSPVLPSASVATISVPARVTVPAATIAMVTAATTSTTLIKPATASNLIAPSSTSATPAAVAGDEILRSRRSRAAAVAFNATLVWDPSYTTPTDELYPTDPLRLQLLVPLWPWPADIQPMHQAQKLAKAKGYGLGLRFGETTVANGGAVLLLHSGHGGKRLLTVTLDRDDVRSPLTPIMLDGKGWQVAAVPIPAAPGRIVGELTLQLADKETPSRDRGFVVARVLAVHGRAPTVGDLVLAPNILGVTDPKIMDNDIRNLLQRTLPTRSKWRCEPRRIKVLTTNADGAWKRDLLSAVKPLTPDNKGTDLVDMMEFQSDWWRRVQLEAAKPLVDQDRFHAVLIELDAGSLPANPKAALEILSHLLTDITAGDRKKSRVGFLPVVALGAPDGQGRVAAGARSTIDELLPALRRAGFPVIDLSQTQDPATQLADGMETFVYAALRVTSGK